MGGFWLASCFISSRRPSWFSALRLFGRSSASPGNVLAISVSFSLHRHPHPAVINVIWLLRVRTLSTHCRCMSALRQETIFFPLAHPAVRPGQGTTVVLIDGPAPFSSAHEGKEIIYSDMSLPPWFLCFCLYLWSLLCF